MIHHLIVTNPGPRKGLEYSERVVAEAKSVFLRTQENFQNAAGLGAVHGAHTVREWVFFADETVDVDRVFHQQVERGLETSATRADDRDFIDDDASGVDLG